MTKPKDCLSLPSAGRFAHELQYVATTAPLSSVFKDVLDGIPHLSVFVFQCLYIPSAVTRRTDD